VVNIFNHCFNISQAANDGATPAYIAAQSGFHGCVELLAALGADLKQADNRMTTALHQVYLARSSFFYRLVIFADCQYACRLL
jgi:ankyrin repeat protein